jgi:hypothetical protein
VIPETAYETIRTPIVFDFKRRIMIPWPVRRIGALGDNAVELLPDVPHPLLNFAQVLRAGRQVEWRGPRLEKEISDMLLSRRKGLGSSKIEVELLAILIDFSSLS